MPPFINGLLTGLCIVTILLASLGIYADAVDPWDGLSTVVLAVLTIAALSIERKLPCP